VAERASVSRSETATAAAACTLRRAAPRGGALAEVKCSAADFHSGHLSYSGFINPEYHGYSINLPKLASIE